jgi:hypothetical protein
MTPDRGTEPWPAAKATVRIREMASDESFTINWTEHVRDQMSRRDLIMGDVLHVLKYGFVHQDAEPATQEGLYRYTIECVTPNSNSRTVKVVVIPSPNKCHAKIITVMWADEAVTKG